MNIVCADLTTHSQQQIPTPSPECSVLAFCLDGSDLNALAKRGIKAVPVQQGHNTRLEITLYAASEIARLACVYGGELQLSLRSEDPLLHKAFEQLAKQFGVRLDSDAAA